MLLFTVPHTYFNRLDTLRRGALFVLRTVAEVLHPQVQTRKHTFRVELFSRILRHSSMAFAHDTEGAKPWEMSRDSPRDPTDPVSAAEQPPLWMCERAP